MSERDELYRQISDLVKRYRLVCLWYMRKDFVPQNQEQAFWALDRIQRYGDAAAFKEAGQTQAMALTDIQLRVCRLTRREAEAVINALPPSGLGTCVMDASGELFRGGLDALESGALQFHNGSLRGSFPTIAPE